MGGEGGLSQARACIVISQIRTSEPEDQLVVHVTGRNAERAHRVAVMLLGSVSS